MTGRGSSSGPNSGSRSGFGSGTGSRPGSGKWGQRPKITKWIRSRLI